MNKELNNLPDDSYENTKKVLLSYCSHSERQRTLALRKLLTQMGDRTPTDMMLKLLHILEDTPFTDEHFLMFLERTTTQLYNRHRWTDLTKVKQCPMSFARKLDDEHEDDIRDIPTLATSQRQVECNAFQRRLETPHGNYNCSQEPLRRRPEQRSQTQPNQRCYTPNNIQQQHDTPRTNIGVCFYQRKFGQNAIKCLTPCTYNRRVQATQRQDDDYNTPENYSADLNL